MKKKYFLNGDQSEYCDKHIRILNTLRNEQYYENNLAVQYYNIIDNMEHMEYKELKFQIAKIPVNPYDVSHYRTGDRENPSMHVYLKDTKNSVVVKK